MQGIRTFANILFSGFASYVPSVLDILQLFKEIATGIPFSLDESSVRAIKMNEDAFVNGTK